MMFMGALATNTGFAARELEKMTPLQLSFWTRCLNLYNEQMNAQND